ncbi:MAG: hypothetical protein WKF87_00640 [Chryseolinea sp.]
MFIPFASLPDHSRLWIYQSNRKFTDEELSIISDALSSFTEQWSAHGSPLVTSFEIKLDQFIVIAADEQHVPASGCSIDGAVRTIKELGQRLGIDFFDRTSIAFFENERVMIFPMASLKKRFNEGLLHHESQFINLLIPTKADLEKGLMVPASSSWLRRYLPTENVAG